MKFNKIMKKIMGRWQEAIIIFSVLIFAGIMTIFQPFDPVTVGYFSDITTPLILIVAAFLVIAGIRIKTGVI